MKCPHGGIISTAVSANSGVTASGQLLLLVADTFTVSGCPHFPPCVTVTWQTGTTRVTVKNVSILTQASQGKCIDGNGSSAGPPLIVAVQTAVNGV